MSLLIPRLARNDARRLIERLRAMPLDELSATLPVLDEPVHLSAVGGRRISEDELRNLRTRILELATAAGYPGSRTQAGDNLMDASIGVALHQLDLTPNEAASEEVWSYLTCCWLLDVALWRFGQNAGEERLIGHVNRNTFRRLWWRIEVLNDPDSDGRPLRGLGEDELVNLTERSTLTQDARLARSMMRVFTDRQVSYSEQGLTRMVVMRDLSKRVLRLTPFIELHVLDDEDIGLLVNDQLDRTLSALAGLGAPEPLTWPALEVAVSPGVEILAGDDGEADGGHGRPRLGYRTAARIALEIAEQTGQVTNGRLREVFPDLDTAAAREVLAGLVAEGRLEVRGRKRGTHYVITTRVEHPSSTYAGASTDSEPTLPAADGIPVADLDLEDATLTALERARITTVEDLIGLTNDGLAKQAGLTASQVAEVSRTLLAFPARHETTRGDTAPHSDSDDHPRTVESLPISPRTRRLLLQNGLRNIDDLTQRTSHQLLAARGLGAGGLREIQEALRALGLQLADEPPAPVSETPHGEDGDARRELMLAQRRSGATLQAIGDDFGVTRERVRQILGPEGIDAASAAATERQTDRRGRALDAKDEILARYRSGEETSQISADLGLAQVEVGDVIREHATDADLAHRRNARLDPTQQYSDRDLRDAIRRVEEQLGRTPSAAEYREHAAELDLPSLPTVANRFGSWSNALIAAGITPNPSTRREYERRWTEESTWSALEAMVRQKGSVPSATEYENLSADDPDLPSLATVRKRLGRWSAVRARLSDLA